MEIQNTQNLSEHFPSNSVTPVVSSKAASQKKTDLIEYLQREGRRSRNLTRLKKLGYGVMLSIFAVVALIWLFSGLSTHHWSEFPWRPLVFLNVFNMLGFMAAASQEQKSAAKTLAEVDDVQCVGVLAEAMEYTDKQGKVEKETRAVAENALTRLLPRLQATDKELLTREQLACLTQALSRDNGHLTLAILKAFEQVGDESCIRSVQNVIDGKSAFVEGTDVRQAATHCLTALKENIETQKLARTLVRPSMGPTEEILLRPVEGNTKTDPELLLRSTSHRD
jgi:hypothetical protein